MPRTTGEIYDSIKADLTALVAQLLDTEPKETAQEALEVWEENETLIKRDSSNPPNPPHH